ncbi:MAG: CheY-like chemotaxis protein [Bermanella sp.]|jgi:CheY-like chemotaxis protein
MQVLESILLIDDDHPTNFLHARVLRKIGYKGEIHEAYNAEKALDFLRSDSARAAEHSSSPVQLIFLDLNMPRVNGWEFLDLYSQEFTSNEHIIVVLTTSLNPDDERRAYNSPLVKAFHRKPLAGEMVKDLVQADFIAFWTVNSCASGITPTD